MMQIHGVLVFHWLLLQRQKFVSMAPLGREGEVGELMDLDPPF